jgi:GT2 family glycosyltransferase
MFKKIARAGITYVKVRPALRNRLQDVATRLGMTQSLRRLYHRLQQRPNDEAAVLRETVVASYPAWAARFDTPSPMALERLARSGEALKPVGILVTFDASSAQQAPELARRLQASIGQPWTAVFLFTQYVDAGQVIQDVRQATKSDLRLSFERTAAPPATDILILIEGGALPRPHALRLFADALRNAPSSLLAYADEDRLIEGSTPADPWFKPEFSPLLSRQGMLLGRMLAVRDSDQDRVWTEFCTTASDMSDFGRRFAQEAGASRIIHIPHVLFHDALPPALPTALTLELPDELPVVSIVIPTRDRWDLLGACLESLRQTSWPADRLDIVVVDNGSTDAKTLKMLAKAEENGQIQVIRDDRQFNWSRLNNEAARGARGELLVFLNNDTEVADPAWLKKLAAHALREETGAVGCKLLFEDRTVQHGGVIAGIQGVAGHAHLFLQSDAGGYRYLANTTHEVIAVTGACLAVTRQNFDAVGGFDENFRVAFNDIAFCFALHKLGKRNVYVADPLFIHYESKSRGYDDTPEKKALNLAEARKAWEQYAELMRADPFYSPNLSLWTPYALAFAPRRGLAWDKLPSRPLRVMMLSVTHAIGHGVAVVMSMHAAALVRQGYEVLIGGPKTPNDFPYPDCERVEVHDALSAATLAAVHGVDLIIAHTPPFFSVARWTGGHPAVIAYDYGEPPPEWFPDTAERQVILTEKDQSLIMATAVYAISNAITSESRTPVDGVIPLGNAHLGRWTEDLVARRDAVRARRDWQGKFVVLNVCRFHIGERRYKGVDLYAKVSAATKQKSAAGSQQAVFVLCGKGTPADVEAMTALGLTVAANVTDEEMTDLYCAADAYANFSQWEGYNLGIGQALAMGLPTIASDIPAHRAFGIDVTNDVEFAADWVLQNAAVQSPRVPKVWSWEAPCKRLVEVIESMVGGLAVDRVPTAPRNSA